MSARLLRALLGALLLLPALVLAQESLLIAGGAGYKRPIDEIANAFEAATRIRVERVYGHMGQVTAQAAASDRMALVIGDLDVLEKASLLSFAQVFPLGRGRLVLAWPRGRQIGSLAALKDPAIRRIGMPDMQQAIFGKAARQALEQAGLFAQLEPRLVVAPTVPQVTAYLQQGEIDAGFINLTEALGAGEKIGGYLEVPQSAYAPLHISAAVLAGRASPALDAFVRYLQGAEARAVFARYGM